MPDRARLSDLKTWSRNYNRGDVGAIYTSVRAFGFNGTLRVWRDGVVVAGNHALKALVRMRDAGETPPEHITLDSDGEWLVPVTSVEHLDRTQAHAFAVADNRTRDLAETDEVLLAGILQEVANADPAMLEATGFDGDDLDAMLAEIAKAAAGPADPPADAEAQLDRAAELQAEWGTAPGQVWALGDHRLVCGDSTDPATIALAVDGATVDVIHADPPYGMGKEADGVANDNLYGPKLDAFQMSWWRACLPVWSASGSAYIWGNPADLWRLWYSGGLADSDDLTFRNEIVWDKGSVNGMGWAGAHSYPPATERCLFFMRGQQFLGNQNADEYWEGFEPLRSWMEEQMALAGWTRADLNRVTSSQMAGHWVSRSQFQPIHEKAYNMLREAAGGRAFVETYDQLYGRLFPDIQAGGNQYRRSQSTELRERRTYFTIEGRPFTDVWQFNRVAGEERHGHATPKPVDMLARALESSVPPGGSVLEPFMGSGSTLIALHGLGGGRRCYGLELEPAYVAVTLQRFADATGLTPVLVGGDHAAS